MPSVSVFGDLMSPTQVIADNVVTAIGKAAEAKPRAGSVTQSSNVDSSDITTDQVDVTGACVRGSAYAVFRSGTEQHGRSIWVTSPISNATPPWKGAELSKGVSGGTVYVEAYTDIDPPDRGDHGRSTSRCNRGDSIAFTGQLVYWYVANLAPGHPEWRRRHTHMCVSGCSLQCQGFQSGMGTLSAVSGSLIQFIQAERHHPDTPDTDYLAGGVWLFVPDDTTSAADYVFGAFGDGNDPFESEQHHGSARDGNL